MPRRNRTKVQRVEALRAVMAGLETHYGATMLVLRRVAYTPAELQAVLQADVDAVLATVAARAGWLTAVKEEQDSNARTDLVLAALEAQIRATFGDDEDVGTVLADFGLAPRKLVVPTGEQMAAAAAKRRATREARGTMGRRQRAALEKGTAPG